jgi:hypothetical protein
MLGDLDLLLTAVFCTADDFLPKKSPRGTPAPLGGTGDPRRGSGPPSSCPAGRPERAPAGAPVNASVQFARNLQRPRDFRDMSTHEMQLARRSDGEARFRAKRTGPSG